MAGIIHAERLGVWTYPHPTEPNQTVSLTLFARPPESQKPKNVTVKYENDDGVWMTKEVKFQPPYLGASVTCDGCGEPFGQQVEIQPDVWVSVPSVAYDTETNGRLNFCQDSFACARRAAERVPAAEKKMIQQAVDAMVEETGIAPAGSRTCAWEPCSIAFLPGSPTQKYHSDVCSQLAKDKRYKAKLAEGKKARAAAGKFPRRTKPGGAKPGPKTKEDIRQKVAAATV